MKTLCKSAKTEYFIMGDPSEQYADFEEHYKNEWMGHQLKTRTNEFCEKIPTSIFCGTWNVSDSTLDDGSSLESWLLPENQSLADLYVIGFQEMVDLNATNIMLDGTKALERSEYWVSKCQSCLELEGMSYSCVWRENLVGVLLVIFVKDILGPHIRSVRSTTQATGLLGMMGNKGGVCIRLNMYDTSVCFVCAHLAAHRENVAGRNADYKTIVDNAVFPGVGSGVVHSAGKVKTYRSLNDPKPNQHLKILPDHDFVIWMGDLNYRVDEAISTSDVFEKCAADKHCALLDWDQLNIERKAGRCFHDFVEEVITFKPTYKYLPNTSEYEMKKGRAPAWCDRILWRVHKDVATDDSVVASNYTATTALTQSDHKPVSIRLTCAFNLCIESKEREIYHELLKTVDKWENDSIPKVEIDKRDLDLGILKTTSDILHESICIKNIGNKVVQWKFVCPFPSMDDDSENEDSDGLSEAQPMVEYCKPFYKYTPDCGFIVPGESTNIDIELSLDPATSPRVTEEWIDRLKSGLETLDDITVLRITKGSDFFCVTHAVFDPCMFE